MQKGEIEITVKTTDGRKWKIIKIEENDTISNLKIKIEQNLGLSLEHYGISVFGIPLVEKILGWDATLKDLKIVNQSTIVLTSRVVGGSSLKRIHNEAIFILKNPPLTGDYA